MSAITVSNLRIVPYSQKDDIAKLVFGDSWSITIKLPTSHQTGDSYQIGIDWENTLIPPNRPLCAGTDKYVLDGDELTFNLVLGTARLRDYVSRIKKPMPLAVQIVRIRNNKAETLMLDSILALPSVIDGAITVCEGDPLAELLDGKMDTPPTEGEAGQVLGINEDGQIVWTTIEIPEQEQADWDESDSEAKSYIRNKPELATVATTGSYNDLTDKPIIPEQEQADWDESDSSAKDYIKNKPTLFSGSYNDLTDKPNLATVATSGDYNDLTNKPIITAPVNADWDESDSSDLAYILNKPDLTVFVEKEEGKGLSTNDFTDADKTKLDNIQAGAEVNVQANWDESDSTADSFIANKPTIPAAQVQSDWDESDSSDPAYIANKPDITALIADALTIHNN